MLLSWCDATQSVLSPIDSDSTLLLDVCTNKERALKTHALLLSIASFRKEKWMTDFAVMTLLLFGNAVHDAVTVRYVHSLKTR